MKLIRRYLAQRKLAKLVRHGKSHNATWSRNRAAQLDGERRKRFLATLEGAR